MKRVMGALMLAAGVLITLTSGACTLGLAVTSAMAALRGGRDMETMLAVSVLSVVLAGAVPIGLGLVLAITGWRWVRNDPFRPRRRR